MRVMATKTDKRFPNARIVMTTMAIRTRSLQVESMRKRRRIRMMQLCLVIVYWPQNTHP